MIKAINKAGMVSEFTEKVWNMMSPNHNGYVEMVEGNEPINVPSEVVEFKAKKLQDIKVEIHDVHMDEGRGIKISTIDTDLDMRLMREYLEGKGEKVHPHIGYTKLKQKYDDSKKSENT